MDSYWSKDQKNFSNDSDGIDNDLLLSMDNLDKTDTYTENNFDNAENLNVNQSKNSVWSDADDNLFNDFNDSCSNEFSENICRDYVNSNNLKKARFN